MWPFTRRRTPGTKLSLINVHDYPRRDYRCYWEIFVAPQAPFAWRVNLVDFDTGEYLESNSGGPCATEDEARRTSQQWVLDRIENYRRKSH